MEVRASGRGQVMNFLAWACDPHFGKPWPNLYVENVMDHRAHLNSFTPPKPPELPSCSAHFFDAVASAWGGGYVGEG